MNRSDLNTRITVGVLNKRQTRNERLKSWLGRPVLYCHGNRAHAHWLSYKEIVYEMRRVRSLMVCVSDSQSHDSVSGLTVSACKSAQAAKVQHKQLIVVCTLQVENLYGQSSQRNFPFFVKFFVWLLRQYYFITS